MKRTWKLSTEQKLLVWVEYVNGVKIRDIAETFGISQVSVWSICSRLRRLYHPDLPRRKNRGREFTLEQCKKGGINCARNSSPEERSEKARRGAMARWGKAMKKDEGISP